MRVGTRADFKKGKGYELFEYICKHFVASLSPHVDYEETFVEVAMQGAASEKFSVSYHHVENRGFLALMEHRGPTI